MKRNKIFAAVFAVMTAAACSNELDNVTLNEGTDLVPVVFNGVTDGGIKEISKTTLNYDIVNWEATDEVTLLSGEGYATATKMTVSDINSNGSATFEGLAEKESDSFLALYPHNAEHLTSNPYKDGGLTVTIPVEQKVVGTSASDYSFQSGANVSVAYSEDDALKFRNIGAVLVFQMWAGSAGRVTKVTVKAKKEDGTYYNLTGSSTVTLDEDTKLPIVGEGDTDHITLLPPEGKSTFYGGRYAFVVYPGDYQSFEITFIDKKGRDFTYTNSEPLSLKRNGRAELGLLNDMTPSGSLLPEGDMTVEVLFNQGLDKWPFIEPIVAAESQAKNGDTYTFPYPATYNGKETYEPLTFVISNGGLSSQYSHTNSYLSTGSHWANKTNNPKHITLPGISGKYLKSVKTTVSNDNKTFSMLGATSELTTAGSIVNFEFPLMITTGEETKVIDSEVGKSYVMDINIGNTAVAKIELLYTVTKPVADATE